MRSLKSRAVLLAFVVTASIGSAGAAIARTNATGDAAMPGQSPRAAAQKETRTLDAATPTTLQRQSGIVLEGSGEAGGLAAMVTVYENSLYGNSLQVVLGDPDDDRIGYVEQTATFVVDGVLSTSVEIDGKSAVLRGTVQESGRQEKLVEPVQDNGEQIVSRGTHTQLLTDVTLTYDGVSVPLEFSPAFAYELEVRRVSLYGN